MKKALIVAGTRPEFIKLSCLFPALERRGVPHIFLHIGQHKDNFMSSQFIQELELPMIKEEVVDFKSTTPAFQTANIMIGVERSIMRVKPDLVVVHGDTNTTFAASIAAVKQHVPVAHVEAGLRSYDWRMPEEHNRRMVDHISSVLLAPTFHSRRNLLRESVIGHTFVTGNTAIDATIHFFPKALCSSKIMNVIDFEKYILTTIHRAENVDSPEFLRELIETIKELPLPVVMPIHPRTVRRLIEYNLLESLENLSPKAQLLPPLGYFDFLVLMKNSSLIMTDSGGIQEEATAPPIKKRVVVIRTSTERPEAVEAGFAVLAGVEREQIIRAVRMCLETSTPNSLSPFGDGNASEVIASLIEGFLQSEQNLDLSCNIGRSEKLEAKQVKRLAQAEFEQLKERSSFSEATDESEKPVLSKSRYCG